MAILHNVFLSCHFARTSLRVFQLNVSLSQSYSIDKGNSPKYRSGSGIIICDNWKFVVYFYIMLTFNRFLSSIKQSKLTYLMWKKSHLGPDT